MAGDNTIERWMTWAFSPTISAILVAFVISLLSPILLHAYLYRKGRTIELPTFLLLGPSYAGKTGLQTLLAWGKAAETRTSIEPGTAECQLPSSVKSADDRYRSEHDTSARSQPSFIVKDTPGHGKLRHFALTTLASPEALKGLIYVVDSAAVSAAAGLTEAAEYLHDVLLVLQKRHTQGKSSKDPNALPVLVAANKQDVFTSLPPGLVRKKLEEEITKVRETRSKGLLDSGVGMDEQAGADEEANWLGEYGSKDFTFAQMEEHGVDVVVAGGNVTGEGEEKASVDEWWAWIGDKL